jgi:hypothetical protein
VLCTLLISNSLLAPADELLFNIFSGVLNAMHFFDVRHDVIYYISITMLALKKPHEISAQDNWLSISFSQV